jgi:hypothetical protein
LFGGVIIRSRNALPQITKRRPSFCVRKDFFCFSVLPDSKIVMSENVRSIYEVVLHPVLQLARVSVCFYHQAFGQAWGKWFSRWWITNSSLLNGYFIAYLSNYALEPIVRSFPYSIAYLVIQDHSIFRNQNPQRHSHPWYLPLLFNRTSSLIQILRHDWKP